MATEVIMPKAGMSMEKGTIVKWFKKEGDKVQVGEALLEIITDKVNMEVEAEVSGILLKIVAKDGDVLPVFTPIGYIGEAGEKVNELKEEKNNISVQTPTEKRRDNVEEKIDYILDKKKIRATPAARKIAKDQHIDLSMINGHGPKGRIQKMDVISYDKNKEKITPLAKKIASAEGVDLSTILGSGHNGKILKYDIYNKLGKQQQQGMKEIEEQENRKIISLSPMRKVIGKRMSDSFFIAPTFTLNIEVDMTKAKELRGELKDAILEETGCKVTFTDIIIMGCAKILKKHPIVNASLVEEGLLLHDHVSIALAVGLDEGLLVPVIKDTDKMKLSEIVKATKDLASRAGNMKLKPNEQEGSTFTISNLGMYGISHFNPIINQPNSAILGISAMIDRPVVINEEVKIRPMMNMSMTIDHRVIDGTPGARFLQDLKQLLENPMRLFI